MSLAISDFLLVLSAFFFLPALKFRQLAIVAFVSLFFLLLAVLNSHFAINILLSLGLKLVLSFGFLSIVRKRIPTQGDMYFVFSCFWLLSIFVFFGSDFANESTKHIANPNEGVNYLLVFWIMHQFYNLLAYPDKKMGILVTFLPLLMILFLSLFYFSRQGIIAAAAFIFFFILLNKKLPKVLSVILLSSAVTVAAYGIASFTIEDNYNNRRLQTMLTGEVATRSDGIRLAAVKFGVQGFLSNPIGHGAGSFLRNNPDGYVAHNFYVNLLYEFGIVGLGFCVLLLLKLLSNLRNTRYRRNTLLTVNLISVSFCIQLMFIGGLGKFGIFIIAPIIFYLSRKKLSSRK